MSKRDSDGAGDFEEFDDDLIKAEFDSMVEGLSLDQSAPTTYLDELDLFEDLNTFTPPAIAKKGIREQIRDAFVAIMRWKNNPRSEHPDDGAAL